MTHKIIAIDGPAASGKGTLARNLAAHLNYAYLDTGALYRCVALRVLESGGDPDDESDAFAAAKSLSVTLKPDDLQNPALRNDKVANATSRVSRFPAVRKALLDFQRDFAAHPQAAAPVNGAILDGRDIGTVICPEADVKFFVTASTEERARRRFTELSAKGIKTTQDAVFNDMSDRDARDSNRDTAPLKPAPDAHILDTSLLSESEVMERALSIIASAA